MRKYLLIILGLLLLAPASAFAVPYYQSTQSMVPFITDSYYLGTTTPSTLEYAGLVVKTICLSGSCMSSWPSGGGGSGVATTSLTASYPVKVTSNSATINFSLLDMATTTATCSGTVSCSQFVVIGSSPITITGSGGTDPFWVYANSAVSTSSPVLITASSTIGNGTQTGGLTISGGATTTGNAYFAGNVGISTTSPTGALTTSPASRANVSTYGLYSSVTGNGGGNGTNVAGYFNAADNSTNYSIYADSGSIYLNGPINVNGNTISNVGNMTIAGLAGSPAGNLKLLDTTTSGSKGGEITLWGDVTGQGGSSNSKPFAGIKAYNNGGYPDSSGGLIFSTQASTTVGSSYSTLAEAMRITSTGNVGIGTTTPWGKLAVNSFNAGSEPQFIVASSSGSLATTTAFIIDQAGNIGIGTSTPGSLLSVGGVANFTTATSTFYSTGGINLEGGCYAINGTCLATFNGTAASSTLLGDNNTFSGSNIFSRPLSLTSTTGTTTIASGQGFTVGSSQFVVQQGSGDVGIGTSAVSDAPLVISKTNTTGLTAGINTSGSILESSNTSQQQLENFGAYAEPTGASLNALYGQIFLARIQNSATPITNYEGIFSNISPQSTYTGTITTASDFLAGNPTNTSGKPITNLNGLNIQGFTNGDGVTSGTITNRGIGISASTASSSAGGTINNESEILVVPTGSPNGGTTNNYGLYVTGSGGNSTNGGTAVNYALYDNSAANNYFAGNVGIGTTTPWATFSVSAASSTVAFNPVEVISALMNTTTYILQEIDEWGHLITSGPAPTITSCGSTPSGTVSGNDRNGTITVGGTATGCVLTFAHAYATAPDCVISNQGMSVVNALTYTVSASAITISQTGLSSDLVNYICQAHQ